MTELHRFQNHSIELPFGLFWDTLRLFYEMCQGIREAARSAECLDGIGIDTWGVDFGLLSHDHGLLGNPRHYRDHRNEAMPERVFQHVAKRDIFFETGVQFMPINSLYQLYAIAQTTPELLSCAGKLLFMPDLFNYFLTGTYACERTVASTSQFYNPVRRIFSTDMLRRLGIKASFFADLIDPGMELGRLLPHVSSAFSVGSEPMVYTTGSHDTASAVAAVPASARNGWCYISSGTWSLMGVEVDAPVINDAALEANFTNEVGVENTIRFLKNIPGLWPLQECRRVWARRGHEYSYDELIALATQASATETIVDLDQFVAPGDFPARVQQHCRDTGQQVPEDPGAIARVLLQSLATRYVQVLDTLESLTGRHIEVIHIVGGGSRNKLLNQFTADATGRRVIAGPAEATAVGNVLVQAMGSGEVQSLQELRAIVRTSFVVEEYHPQG